MNTPKFWHWPDHVAGKRETRRLREEHNAAMNSRAELLEALEHLTGQIDLSRYKIRDDFSLINAHACALRAIHKTKESNP